ncbi:hypothetical protein HDE_14358 [Halotydeus destructor]|nr:hypothetical protein HDE_14358 [Halotydeus destructor]
MHNSAAYDYLDDSDSEASFQVIEKMAGDNGRQVQDGHQEEYEDIVDDSDSVVNCSLKVDLNTIRDTYSEGSQLTLISVSELEKLRFVNQEQSKRIKELEDKVKQGHFDPTKAGQSLYTLSAVGHLNAQMQELKVNKSHVEKEHKIWLQLSAERKKRHSYAEQSDVHDTFVSKPTPVAQPQSNKYQPFFWNQQREVTMVDILKDNRAGKHFYMGSVAH